MELTLENLNLVPQVPGVYKIYARSLDGIGIPINRMAAIDTEGLVYIGRTIGQTLQKRLYNFVATARLNSRTTNHPGALKYRTLPVIQQALGRHSLFYEVIVCVDPALVENTALADYRRSFGEYPPLNK
jgi:hypothetical protein